MSEGVSYPLSGIYTHQCWWQNWLMSGCLLGINASPLYLVFILTNAGGKTEGKTGVHQLRIVMVSHHVLKAILSKDNHVTLVTKRKCLLL
jgi:hypothetical protein